MCTFFVIKGRYIALVLLLCACAGMLAMFSAAANVQTATVAEAGVFVPILMYHSILKDPRAAGEYVISPQTLEADLRYLKENGYTTVVGADLIAYVESGTPLPEKPVMITFDDGHANNLLYALPLFEKLDMRGVICVVGKYSEEASASDDHNPSYAYLSWDEIRTLRDSGRFEIANHSYDMHKYDVRKGTAKKRGESCKDYDQILRSDLEKTQKLLKEYCDIDATAFSYPYGAVCEESLAVVRSLGFRLSYGCSEKVNYITDAESLYCLGRFNRPSGISTPAFMKRIQKTY